MVYFDTCIAMAEICTVLRAICLIMQYLVDQNLELIVTITAVRHFTTLLDVPPDMVERDN